MRIFLHSNNRPRYTTLVTPDAVAEAQSLVETVMRERGYPVTNYEQTVADLSVDHARVLDRFRTAHAITEQAGSGQVSTDELRTAMLYYRELFDQLLARPATGQIGGSEPDAPGPQPPWRRPERTRRT